KMFWPLAAYAGVTLIASVFSVDPRVSLVDSKQLVLLIIVPLTYRLFRGRRALLAVDVIITVGAVSATYGIVQYLILNFDHLGRRRSCRRSSSHWCSRSRGAPGWAPASASASCSCCVTSA